MLAPGAQHAAEGDAVFDGQAVPAERRWLGGPLEGQLRPGEGRVAREWHDMHGHPRFGPKLWCRLPFSCGLWLAWCCAWSWLRFCSLVWLRFQSLSWL